jgi:hypothetical protein
MCSIVKVLFYRNGGGGGARVVGAQIQISYVYACMFEYTLLNDILKCLCICSRLRLVHTGSFCVSQNKTEHFCHTNLSCTEKFVETYYVRNSISKLQIQVSTYVFELSAGNCHR